MPIHTNQLTRLYGSQRAVDEVSISLSKGEIVGFLGPNGAGKSTTMKMLTGYLRPTSGTATVAGHDITTDTLAVKRAVGYLPEHNPLYKDLYVKEYLSFVARIHGLNVKQSVNDVIEKVGLTRESHKHIHQLSKGYRQRVGLAQAIMHDPEVLVLDEPTSGLDPNQLVEIRQLIKSTAKNKTVLFSSHILQEVQALCDRIIIINQGKIVADSEIGEIASLMKGQRVLYVDFEKAIDQQALDNLNNKIDAIQRIEGVDHRRYKVTYDNADVRRDIFEFAVASDNAIMGMEVKENSMESVFSTLTENKS